MGALLPGQSTTLYANISGQTAPLKQVRLLASASNTDKLVAEKRNSYTIDNRETNPVSTQSFTETEPLVTTYIYDVLGNLIEVIDDAGNHTYMTYDWLSRKKDMTDPDMGHWYYYYDNNGNLIAQVDNKQSQHQATNLYYDALNRLKGKTYSTTSSPATYSRPTDPGTVLR
jgi:YD repeat-containing protein